VGTETIGAGQRVEAAHKCRRHKLLQLLRVSAYVCVCRYRIPRKRGKLYAQRNPERDQCTSELGCSASEKRGVLLVVRYRWENHLALSEHGASGLKLLPLPDMQGRQPACIMYMDHMGSQARYARPSGRMYHVYGSYGLAGPICIMYYDVQHMGSQARYARPSGRIYRVYAAYGLAGPICIMYYDDHMSSD
jgi:hypothetical protein